MTRRGARARAYAGELIEVLDHALHPTSVFNLIRDLTTAVNRARALKRNLTRGDDRARARNLTFVLARDLTFVLANSYEADLGRVRVRVAFGCILPAPIALSILVAVFLVLPGTDTFIQFLWSLPFFFAGIVGFTFALLVAACILLERTRARDFALALARARDLNRARALALACERTRASDFVRDLARASVFDFAFDLAPELDRDLALDRDLDLTSVLALDLDLNRARDLTSVLALDLALASALARARVRDRNRRLAASGAGAVGAGGAPSMPGRARRGVLALAVRLLPVAQRPRYRDEFEVELVELPRRQRWGYALRVLVRAWELRRALVEAMRTVESEPARRAEG